MAAYAALTAAMFFPVVLQLHGIPHDAGDPLPQHLDSVVERDGDAVHRAVVERSRLLAASGQPGVLRASGWTVGGDHAAHLDGRWTIHRVQHRVPAFVAAQCAFRPRPGVPADGPPRCGLRRRADFRLQPVPRRADGSHSGACVVVDAARAPCAARRVRFRRQQAPSRLCARNFRGLLAACRCSRTATSSSISRSWSRCGSAGSPRGAAIASLASSAVSLWTVAAATIAPVLLKYRAVHAYWGLRRSYGEIVGYSADVLSFFTAGELSGLWRFRPVVGPEQELYPGIVALLLVIAWVALAIRQAPARGRQRRLFWALIAIGAAFGLVAAVTLAIGPWSIGLGPLAITGGRFRKPLSLAIVSLTGAMLFSRAMAQAFRSRSVLAFYVLATVVCWLMCLGPFGRFGGTLFLERPPYFWLIDLPGFNALRVPTRFAMVGALTLAIAAAVGFARFITPRARLLAAAILAALIADAWPRPIPVVGLPTVLSFARRREGCGDRRASAGRQRCRRRRRDGPRHRAPPPSRERVQRSLPATLRGPACGVPGGRRFSDSGAANNGAGVRGHRPAVERDRPRASGRGRRRPTRRRRWPLRVLSLRTGAPSRLGNAARSRHASPGRGISEAVGQSAVRRQARHGLDDAGTATGQGAVCNSAERPRSSVRRGDAARRQNLRLPAEAGDRDVASTARPGSRPGTVRRRRSPTRR